MSLSVKAQNAHRISRLAAQAVAARTLQAWLLTNVIQLTKQYIDMDWDTCECGHCGFEDEPNETHRAMQCTHRAWVNRARRLLLPTLGTHVLSVVHGYWTMDWSECTCTTCQTPAWAQRLGHALMENVSFQIGSHDVDRHYGEWLSIWDELADR